MSFQKIVSNQTSMDLSYRRAVGQSVTRGGYIRTADYQTAVPWQFTVNVNNLMRYSTNRDLIARIDQLDRSLPDTIQLSDGASTVSNAKLGWYTVYQGTLNTVQQSALFLSSVSNSVGGTVVIGGCPTGSAGSQAQLSFSWASAVPIPSNTASLTITTTNVPDFPTTLNSSAVSGGANLTQVLNTFAAPTGWSKSVSGANITFTRTAFGPAFTGTPVLGGSNSTGWVGGTPSFSSGVPTDGTSPTGGFVFRAGDFIQLPAGSSGERYVYKVVSDVPYTVSTTNTVQLHRSIIGSPTTGASAFINVGSNCIFKMVALQLPTYGFETYQNNDAFIRWTGPFVFQEYIIG